MERKRQKKLDLNKVGTNEVYNNIYVLCFSNKQRAPNLACLETPKR